MIDPVAFQDIRLHGGFIIRGLNIICEPIVDALDREAVAQTRIIGQEFHLFVRDGLSQEELSVTLYHEILEAAAVASQNPPLSVVDFNEGDFEREARNLHSR